MTQGKQRRSYRPEFKVRAVERMRAGEGVSALAVERGRPDLSRPHFGELLEIDCLMSVMLS
jgi:hypothetical protein